MPAITQATAGRGVVETEIDSHAFPGVGHRNERSEAGPTATEPSVFMMRTPRYLILPIDGLRISDSTTPVHANAKKLLSTLQLTAKDVTATRKLGKSLAATVRSASAALRGVPAGDASAKARPAIEVIESLHEDGVKLVSASQEVLAALRQEHPGIRVIEEKFCHRALAPRVSLPPKAAKRGGVRATAVKTTVVVEVLRSDTMKPVKGADVIAFRTKNDALQKSTNASGKAKFTFTAAAPKLKSLYVYHEEPGVWGYFKANVKVSQGQVRVLLASLNLATEDTLRFFHKAGALSDGTGVRVGVIDSGADLNHPDLAGAIEGGANCVPGSNRPANDFGPDGAHGTHVAGTIAARGTSPTGVRGVAPGAKLRIYRVFENGNSGSGSSFAVIDAIERAITDQCDIINLSLGFDPGVTDEAISDALLKARKHGILPVAAAGNDGRQPVGFPGCDSSCVAVSAVGRKGYFPKTSTDVPDAVAPFGTDPRNFLAGFSNVGADLDATGSGVAVVSTFPGGYGPMSGTSMASPAVAGMAARLLGAHPAVLAMPKDAARSDAIRKLVMDACHSLGLGILFEGAGLPK